VWENSRLYEDESAAKISGSVTGNCHLTFKLIFSHLYFFSLPAVSKTQSTTKNALNKPIPPGFLETGICERQDHLVIFVVA
jgi:hypothetical protein